MTRTEVQTAAEAFLQALDAAPTGTGTVLKDRGSKEWMETCVLRALAKLDAATYHSSRVARLVTESNEKGAAFFQTLELGADGTEGKWTAATKTVGSTRGVQEIAFEIDAFLAASRAAIDFGGAVLALHTGMGKRTGITTFLEVIKKAKKPIFPFLFDWAPWIEALKAYRDECVHYRALRMQTGYEAVSRNGKWATAILPIVIPEEIGDDRPDTRAERLGLYGDEGQVGLDKVAGWADATMSDGSVEVLEHTVTYMTASGFVCVEQFCGQHLDQLRGFLVAVFGASLAANFALQRRNY
jgi:hypothetical protein